MMLLAGPCGPTCGGASGAYAPDPVWPFFLFLAICCWVALQFRPAKRAVWERRATFIAPLFRHIGADVFAVVAMVTNFFKARWQGKQFRDQLGKDDSWPWS
jgi:hypothetical protein